jgi:DNA-binding response OmpR family regulator
MDRYRLQVLSGSPNRGSGLSPCLLALSSNYAESAELEAVFDTNGGEASDNKLKLTVLMSRLRAKISPFSGDVNPIRAVRHRGYQLCIALRMV